MIPLIIFFFAIIGAMRVIQRICSKNVSNKIEGNTYFHFGGYYQLIAAVLALVAILFIPEYTFDGFSATMLWCSVGMAAFITLGLFTEIEAMKGTTLIVVQMFAAGSIVLAALFGHFYLEQQMNVYQWLGLGVFLISTYLMVSQDGEKKDKAQENAEDVHEKVQEQPKQKISLKTIIMLLLLFIAEGGMMIVQTIFSRSGESPNDALFSFVMFAINALILYICYLVQALFIRKPVQQPTQEIAQESEQEQK